MNKKTTALLIVQFAAVVASGIIAKDGIYAITVSVIGLVFNFLVSLNIPYGFIFGFAYAITNGILAFRTGAYATFAFMIFLQAPMAIYSFFKWKRKKSGGGEIMKKMTPAWIIGLCVFMALLGVGSYFALGKLGGSAVITDTIFFVFSVTACLLLAGCFKNAYILTLLSGLGGTALWLYQLINQGIGLSVAVFYIIVSINSVIAVYQQYFSKKHRGA